ncbi:MAG TPA: glycosyltransferase family 39 protein, partial [Ktedonobacterales bacterium]|nr:glycosyltransferase family 39 protein [Ktedonobacterales bacterium]
FFFVSYDPGGFVTVDKPPLGFWAQVLSVKLLGFSGLGLLLPEALAGVISVVVLWRVVRQSFGSVAGVLAALALAVSPINVVTNRDNILEPMLTLTLLLAAWAIMVAVRRGGLRWLLLSAALVGLGFNIKMLEAYLLVPALALVYLISAPSQWRSRLRHLALASVVLVALSLSWAQAVDMVPAAQRPYVGSTLTNSELVLALGYNGIGRLFGGLPLSFLRHAPTPARTVAHAIAHSVGRVVTSSGGSSHPGSGVYPRDVRGVYARIASQRYTQPTPNPAGTPGPLRLFQASLGSQVSWLLPLALIGLLSLAVEPFVAAAPAHSEDRPFVASPTGWRTRLASLWPRWSGWIRTSRGQGLLLWGGWLVTGGVLFSFARSINAYYVAVLAPAICAFAGLSAIELWRTYRASWRSGAERGLTRWLGFLLPVALIASAAQQSVLLSAAPNWRPWLTPTLLVASATLAGALCLFPLVAKLSGKRTQAHGARLLGPLATAVATIALATTVIAPTLWSFSSLTWGNAGGWPSAGPEFARADSYSGPLVDKVMMRYLLAHRGEDRFIVGALNAYVTAPIIVATGQPVLDMGGFTGSDPILTDQLLARLVARDQVHLFLLPSSNVTAAQQATLFVATTPRGASRLGMVTTSVKRSDIGARRTSYTNALTRWISLHCQPVPPSQWSSASYVAHRLGAWELFSCQT